jgi:hypothetical protein
MMRETFVPELLTERGITLCMVYSSVETAQPQPETASLLKARPPLNVKDLHLSSHSSLWNVTLRLQTAYERVTSAEMCASQGYGSTARVCRAATPEDWERHKHTVKQLYLEQGCTQKTILQVLAGEYNFHPT